MGHVPAASVRARRTHRPACRARLCARIGSDRRSRPVRRLPLRRRPVRAGDEPSAGSRRAPVFGGAVSVEMANGHWFEALFTHQQADVDIRSRAVQSAGSNPGGRQSLAGRRPSGPRYGPCAAVPHRVPGAHPLRGRRRRRGPVHARRRRGRQVPLARHLGVRLDGRVFTTFVDVDAAAACAGGCIVGLNVNVVWQAEFTAGLVIVF